MNARISTLLAESTQDILGVAQVDHAQFAHSILQQCLAKIAEMSLPGTDPNSTYHNFVIAQCMAALKEHFGDQR